MPTLTVTQVKNAKPIKNQKQTRLYDNKGMFLLIKPNQEYPAKPPGKWWRLKYRFQGKEKLISLGTLKDTSLKEARDQRDAALKLLEKGIDPSQHRQSLRAGGDPDNPDSFENIAREWLDIRATSWAPSTAEMAHRRLEQFVFPWLGSQSILDIETPEILQTLRRIESRGTIETTHRVKALCSRVFKYAIATGRAQRNPVADIGEEALTKSKTKHMATITDPREIGGLLRAIDGYTGTHVTRCALKLAPLLFVRPGELRTAEWLEFDVIKQVWRIPAEKMKMDHDHIVPLPKQAVAVLKDLKPLTGDGKYVFPSVRTGQRCMSENTVNGALRRLGYTKDEICGHGFRAMASTNLHELGYESDWIEIQLAHLDDNKVRAAYKHAKYMAGRKEMMQSWADYLDGLREGGQVVSIKSKSSS